MLHFTSEFARRPNSSRLTLSHEPLGRLFTSSAFSDVLQGRLCGWVLAGVAVFASTASRASDEIDPARSTIAPSVIYDGAAIGVLRGGARTGGTYVGSVHLRLEATAPTTSSWAGTTALFDLRTLHGQSPDTRVGDAQGVSNIAGPSGTDIEELWVQHNFSGSSLSVLGGIYDLNTEFYRLQAAGLFLNSSFGIGPEFSQSGVEGPSIFPRTAVGIRVAAKPAPGVVLRAALLDGVPVVRPDRSRGAFRSGDGALMVAEAAFLSRPTEAADDHRNPRTRIGRFSTLTPYQDKLAFGVWHYAGSYPDIGVAGLPGAQHRGNSGGYAVGEWRLLGRVADAQQTLSAFMQLGMTSPSVNRFDSYAGMGLTAAGWIAERPTDQIGLSVASARNGAPYMQSQSTLGMAVTRRETTFELSYLTQPTKWLSFQPDLQYVVHPDTDRRLRNAWVVQIRFEISF